MEEKFRQAQEVAFKEGWEGDFRGKPRIIPIPMDVDFRIEMGFLWTQNNNGHNFFVSPVRQGYLESSFLTY